jgi:hypothetical protein
MEALLGQLCEVLWTIDGKNGQTIACPVTHGNFQYA